MVEIALILLILGAFVLLIGPRIMRKRGAGSDWLQGTLLVTGVSPRPEGVTGEQFVTITGVINGPTVNEYTVYTRLTVDVNQWPTMGQLIPVMYSPGNPEKWAFGSRPEPTPPPPDQQPYT
ncbi:hypothetical protein [Mycolicibacterium iranicum]|uniref:DUF3592 domain-containing protein n=1 Tax=Mycolicibacterium iranicum TaxID=912594 RepID=A0ABT4HMS0_MYCIR|nr:hypothetical protein [Mycolicibacterium iranicum]MCZ0731518.1 hypothetical protein [Mycolicibacterium iranicum]